MKLKSIHIKNFRSIKDSGEINEITKIFALIGRNNTGKSTFLKSIQILFAENGIEENDFHKDTDEEIEISGVIEKVQDDNTESVTLKVTCKKGEKIIYEINGKETAKASYSKSIPTLLSISDIRNPSDSTTGGQKTTLLQRILKLQEAENGTEFSKKFNELSIEVENLKVDESKTISVRLTEKFKEVVNEKDFSISITPEVNLEKGISYTTGITNKNIPNAKSVDILNSGTGMQSMYILSLLEVYGEMSTKDNQAILIIEEPEVYLHPTYQRQMFAAIRRIAENNQVIFTTHSPIMISDIWLTESVRQVRLNNDGETIIEGVKIEDVIAELGIRYEDVLNPKVVVFVEGTDDEKFYTKLGLDNPKIKIISTDGFRAIHYYAFIKIITSENVISEFVLISDGDGQDKTARAQYLIDEISKQFAVPPLDLNAKLSDKIYVLDKYSIESYLVKEEVLIKAFPEIDSNSIKTCVEEYDKKYAEEHQKVKDGTISLQNFGRYMKPKLLFEPCSNEKAEEAYATAWVGYDNYLKVRALIHASCRQISATDKDYFEHVLSCANMQTVPELVTIKDSVLALLDN